jgi:hypothetical protein
MRDAYSKKGIYNGLRIRIITSIIGLVEMNGIFGAHAPDPSGKLTGTRGIRGLQF